jgi:hypothetical protein
MRKISAQEKRHQVKLAMKGQNRWTTPRPMRSRLTQEEPRSTTESRNSTVPESAWTSSTSEATC